MAIPRIPFEDETGLLEIRSDVIERLQKARRKKDDYLETSSEVITRLLDKQITEVSVLIKMFQGIVHEVSVHSDPKAADIEWDKYTEEYRVDCLDVCGGDEGSAKELGCKSCLEGTKVEGTTIYTCTIE